MTPHRFLEVLGREPCGAELSGETAEVTMQGSKRPTEGELDETVSVRR
jgi:hypothetical protein